MTAPEVCDACARRSWLVARLATSLELIRGTGSRVREVLALPDERLIVALAGREAAGVAAEWARADPAELRERWSGAGAHGICRHAPGYPVGLLALSDAPAVLHVAGEPARIASLRDPEDRRTVAIVGSRRASPAGRDIARDIARGLSGAGVCVVSGMAMGIDAAAHEGALALGANTVAVLACSPLRAYPRSRARLHRELLERGLVVGELPPGTEPFRWAFPARNRIIAALAHTTVIVEAAERSGSLITAEIAADLGRGVAAVPGSPASWHSVGANALLRDGASLVRHARDVLDDLCLPALTDREDAVPAGLEPALAALLETVAACADPLAGAPDPRAVRIALTRLELLGLVERLGDGRYRRVRP